MQHSLKIHSHHHNVPDMVYLTDRAALLRNRCRAMKNGSPAMFLHEIARDEIKDRLELINKDFKKIGVITGYPGFWQNAFPDAECVADDETLALDSGKFDLVIHAMCLHWANDPVGQMIQSRRALKPDGVFLATLFGGETLHELRSSLAQAEADLFSGLSPRVAPMAEIRDLGGLLQRADFALPVADNLPLRVSYATPQDLMHDLRAMGETNALINRQRRGMQRTLLKKACEIYKTNFPADQDSVIATFDIIVLTGWSPDESQPKPLRPGSAVARLADALGTTESTLKD